MKNKNAVRKSISFVLGLILCLSIAAPAFAATEPRLISSITVRTDSTGGTALLSDVYDRLQHDWFSLMFGEDDFSDAVRTFTMSPSGTVTFDRNVVIHYAIGEISHSGTRSVSAGETVRISDFPRLAVDTRGLTNAAQWPTAPRYTFFEFMVESDSAFSDHFIAPGEIGSFHLQEALNWLYRNSDDEWRRDHPAPWGPGFVQDLAVPSEPTPPTTSQPSSWAAVHVNAAIAAGLVPQTLQSQYTQATTRAEFAALAVALYETVTAREITGRMQFNDTNDINVQKMGYLGVVTGVGGGNFAPSSTLTREQAAVMLARLANVIGQPLLPSAPTFADNAQISSWAVDGVGQMQASGIMGGVGNNQFAPGGDYTREQSIVTILRLFDMMD